MIPVGMGWAPVTAACSRAKALRKASSARSDGSGLMAKGAGGFYGEGVLRRVCLLEVGDLFVKSIKIFNISLVEPEVHVDLLFANAGKGGDGKRFSSVWFHTYIVS
jgi:hypothetical protein